MASAGLICQGEAGRRYRLVRPLGTVRGKSCNVWLGLDDSKPDAEYIMKRPLADQNEESWSGALSAFKHELEMQRLFAKDPMIRKLVDYVPESEPSGLMMVLEAFTDSLWDARNVRPFTTKEIKWIMKGVLLGIFTVHMKGLVYTVSKPSTREITSLTYRSPEVHFGKPWSSSTDVWSWGVILAQLLQAQVDFKSPGMYDSIQTGTLAEKGNVIRDQLAIDFDLSSVPFYAEDEQCAKFLPTPQPEEAYMWANTMIEKGVSGEDIQFLVEVLNPDPNARLTVREILESGYLEV
ncbi:hypothetical protein CBS115988_157 [Aspergillus niger]|uniref:cyclin-dependent kinase n=2 Tax=Aspergillus niger TaxID=5061 RepID=A2QZJ4_ASPNC|nr:uncharacterized protein An12g05120 [Aspergillus niger]KAI2862369.1 hypothetical protein CBS11232_590 [Aspergillus niger]KAI2882230.1 hypothetical protein CBS115988_157 [Aspergillus niger]KAI2882699.1 hypothetical protein CBS11852_9573 [Aspergillus niger]KAI3003022.1 hypothetical protein CBS147346_5662 [Aspergillus niger]CAK46226.1 unnamed protein product [Aspergillus niger]